MQKEFEEIVSKGTYEEISNSIDYSVSPFKNKNKALFLAAERGNVEIFKLMFHCGKKFKKGNLDIMEFSKVLFEHNSLDIIKLIFEDKKYLDYSFVFTMKYMEKTKFLSGFFSYIYKENINIEIVEYIFNEIGLYSMKRNESIFQLLKVIVDNKLVNLVNEKFADFLEYDTINTENLINYSKETGKMEVLREYLKEIKQDYKLEKSLISVQKNTKEDFIENFENKHNKFQDINITELELAMWSKKYQLIKKYYLKAQKRKDKLEALKVLPNIKNKRTVKDVFNIYIKDEKYNINKDIEDVIQKCCYFSNYYLLKLMLNQTKKRNFKNDVMSKAVYNKEGFDILVEDGRFNKDTLTLKAFNTLVILNDIVFLVTIHQ